jgi:hypothetical protein
MCFVICSTTSVGTQRGLSVVSATASEQTGARCMTVERGSGIGVQITWRGDTRVDPHYFILYC